MVSVKIFINIVFCITFIVEGSAIQIYRNDYISKNLAIFIMVLLPNIAVALIIFNKRYLHYLHNVEILLISTIISFWYLLATLFYFDLLYPEWWPYLHF